MIWCHCSKQNKKYWFFKILKTWNILKVNPMPGTTLAFANYIKKTDFIVFSWFFLSDLNRKQTRNKKQNCFLGVAVHPEVMLLVFENQYFSSVPLTAVRKPSWFYEKKKLSTRNCSTKFLQEFKFRVLLIEFRLHLCYQGS